DGPVEAEAQQSELAAMSVAGENEVRLPLGHVLEAARIVQQHQTRLRPAAGEPAGDGFDLLPPPASAVVDADDLHGTHLGGDDGFGVDEEPDPVRFERPAPLVGAFEVVAAAGGGASA